MCQVSMTNQSCLDAIAGSDEHVLPPAAGMPTLLAGVELTAGVRTFYERAGGATLYRRRDFSIDIVPSGEFKGRG